MSTRSRSGDALTMAFPITPAVLPILAGILAILAAAAPAQAQVNVLTNRYDPQRTGANLGETTLTAANVNATQFGKLYSYPVDGAVYAQPLYVTGITVQGTVRNVLFVATMNDKLYAFDADSSSPSPLWIRDFTSPPSVTAIPITDISGPNLNIIGTVGIQSTPVIDGASGTIYLVVRTKESGAYVQRLHALDITSGLSRPTSPVTIAGSVPGTAPDSTAGPSGPVVTFDPKMNAQRTGLALTNGVVMIAWGSHEDLPPYHGWVMGYDASSLARVGVFCVTPDVYAGGIWQGGRAPTIDAAGNAYYATGNGLWDGTRHFGDSLLKFSVSRSGLALIDYFTPSNQAALSAGDDDLSGSGFTMLPGTNLLLGGGKEGVLYLLRSDNLGHLVSKDAQIVQKIPVTGGHVMGGPVFWNSSSAGPLVYNWSEDDLLKAYRLSGGMLALPPYAQGQVASPGHPGGSLTLTANGSAAGTGIVWASMPTTQDGLHGLVAGVLRAFNADTLNELWSSEQNAGRDRVGTLMKFVPPVVVNGRVYMPSHDNAVAVYGLLPSDFTVGVTPGSRAVRPGSSVGFTVSVGTTGGFAGPVSLGASGQPAGTTVSFNPPSITGGGTATMTVSVPAAAALGSFSVAVSGTSGARVHPAAPVLVNVVGAYTGLGAIGIDFVGTNPSSMGPTESAGAVPQTNWNGAVGAAPGTPLALVDESGVATNAVVTWSAPAGGWMTPIADAPGNARMMKGYLDTTNIWSTATVTVEGLSQRVYDVYVYVDGDNRVYDRTGSYTISGSGIATRTINLTDAANTNFGGSLTPANNSIGNYLKFSVNATGFTITATPLSASGASLRAPINGVQIVPVPQPDFTIAATPASRTVTRGASTTYTITTGALNGFSGSVSLGVTGAPAGTTAAFSPASVSGSGTATLTVTTSSGTPAGNSTLTITGTAGSLSHDATAALVVNAPSTGTAAIGIDFVGSSPAAVAAGESAGVVPQSNWNSAVGQAQGTPLALIDASGAASGATVTWSAPGGGWMTPIADAPGNARLMKGYLDTSSTSTTIVSVEGLSPRAYDVYVYADGDNKGYERSAAYTISGPGITTRTINLTDAANTNFGTVFTPADNSSGNYVRFNIQASAFTLTATPGPASTASLRAPVNAVQIVPVPSPDFTIAATPGSSTVTQGSSTTYAIATGALNGFAGTVSLAVSGAPAGTTASFSPASVSGSGSASLNVTTSSSTPVGSRSLTITGTSGALTHSTPITLVIEAAPVTAGAIGIDFTGTTPTFMAASEIAGVVPKTNWNTAPGAGSAAPLALVDERGTATPATATWAANAGWMVPIGDQPGNPRLMKGYLDTSTTSATGVTVAGLPPGAYDVYIYIDGDNRTFSRSAAYRLSGTGFDTTINVTDPPLTDFSGTFTQSTGGSGNYIKFSIRAGGFTLTATPLTSTNATLRAPVNAIQIVPAASAAAAHHHGVTETETPR